MKLKHSRVRRGGVTAPRWYGSTDEVDFKVDEDGLRFSFVLPSKGGGDTEIQLTVGPEDLHYLLMDLAHSFPERAHSFTEATDYAVKRLLKTKRGRGPT